MFSHERRKASAKLVARPVHARRQSLASETGSISGHPRGNHTVVPYRQRLKPHIIDYFLVSTLIRPLIQKCEIVKSVPWSPRYGVKLTLSINFGSVVSRQLIGKFSKRNRHNTNSLQGLCTQHTESADPAIWNEARRNCVFEGNKPRCQDGQEDTQAACSQCAHACGFLEEADELGHALETWCDATNQYWVKVGRMCKTPWSGKFATFRMKPVLGETFMPLGCVILEGGGNAELKAWKSFCHWSIRSAKRLQNLSHQNMRCMLPEKLLSSFKVATFSARR